jgi:hypothetical protein
LRTSNDAQLEQTQTDSTSGAREQTLPRGKQESRALPHAAPGESSTTSNPDPQEQTSPKSKFPLVSNISGQDGSTSENSIEIADEEPVNVPASRPHSVPPSETTDKFEEEIAQYDDDIAKKYQVSQQARCSDA